MNFRRWRPELLCLIVAAIITRTWMLFQPNAIVFDEVYFKVFAAHYLDGHYFFDIHPPLGKLIFAGYAYLLHMNPSAMTSGTALPLRVIPAVAGFLLIPLIWAILRRLGATRPFAFLGAFALLLDNSLIVESRFILMDSMLLLFGFAAVYFYLIARDSKRYFWLFWCLSALFAGAAFSVKWTGLTALALILLIWSWDKRNRTASQRRHISELTLMVLIPIILYVSIFWIHFKLLPYSGDGDAFMSTQFQATLVGSNYYNSKAHMSFVDKFFELNKEMYVANATLTATHPYGSHWYMWPLEIRPIYYWEGSVLSNGEQGNIYLLGNPAVYWGIWVAIITGLLYGWLTKRRLRPVTVAALAISGVGFMLNYLPFVPIARIMFQYHYFYAFIYSLIFAVMLWNDIATNSRNVNLPDSQTRRSYYIVLAVIALTFVFFAPLTYGTPLSQTGLQARMWLHSWR